MEVHTPVTDEEAWRDYQTYHIGISEPDNDPSEKEIKSMLHLVAYDVCNPRRLRKVAKCCEDFGMRVEKSVFECDLSEHDFQVFWRELNGEIDPDEDYLVAYRICRSCVKEVKSAGVIERPTKRMAYIF